MNTELLRKETHELLDADARVAEDGAQGSAVQFPMVGDYDLGEGLDAPHNQVAAGLSHMLESCPCQGGAASPPRDAGEMRHTAIRRVSKRSGGTGRPSCSNAAT